MVWIGCGLLLLAVGVLLVMLKVIWLPLHVCLIAAALFCALLGVAREA
jgi:hypothetical protein